MYHQPSLTLLHLVYTLHLEDQLCQRRRNYASLTATMKACFPAKQTAVRITITLVWLVCMLLLLRFEAYPELFTQTLRGYSGVLDETILMREAWSRILVNEIPAGYSHTSMNVSDENEANIEIHNRTLMKAAVAGQPFKINIHATLTLDPDYDLLQFDSAVAAQGMSFRVTGKRTTPGVYAITTFTGELSTKRTIEIPRDVVLYSPMSLLALRKLKLGQELTIKTLDPISMTSTHVLVKAVKHETVTIDSKEREATLLLSNYHGIQLKSWIDQNGAILRQETPLGWVIETCSSETALDAAAGDTSPPELLSLGTGTALMKLLTMGQQ